MIYELSDDERNRLLLALWDYCETANRARMSSGDDWSSNQLRSLEALDEIADLVQKLGGDPLAEEFGVGLEEL